MSNVQMRTTLPRELATDIDRIATGLGISRYQALRQGARLFVELHQDGGELPPKGGLKGQVSSQTASADAPGREAAQPGSGGTPKGGGGKQGDKGTIHNGELSPNGSPPPGSEDTPDPTHVAQERPSDPSTTDEEGPNFRKALKEATGPSMDESSSSKKPSPKPENFRDFKQISKNSGSPSSETGSTAKHGLNSWLKKRPATRRP